MNERGPATEFLGGRAVPVAAPGPPHPRRQKVGEEFDSLLSAPPGRRFRGILRRRADLPRDSAGWPSSSLSNQVIGRRRGPRRARSRPTAPPRRQKLGEEFFPRGFYLSPRHNTGKRTQPTERILPPLSAPPDGPSPASYSVRRSFREILQRPTALPRDSAGPVHISPTFCSRGPLFPGFPRRPTFLPQDSADPDVGIAVESEHRSTPHDSRRRGAPGPPHPARGNSGKSSFLGVFTFSPDTTRGNVHNPRKESFPYFLRRPTALPRVPAPLDDPSARFCSPGPPFPYFLRGRTPFRDILRPRRPRTARPPSIR